MPEGEGGAGKAPDQAEMDNGFKTTERLIALLDVSLGNVSTGEQVQEAGVEQGDVEQENLRVRKKSVSTKFPKAMTINNEIFETKTEEQRQKETTNEHGQKQESNISSKHRVDLIKVVQKTSSNSETKNQKLMYICQICNADLKTRGAIKKAHDKQTYLQTMHDRVQDTWLYGWV